MNQEVLERLMMDRALDGLPSDVEALLDAYLAKEPEKAEHAREINDTVVLAKQVMKPQRPVSLPPLKVSPLPTSRINSPFTRRATWPAALAAAFLFGALLSAAFLRTHGSAARQSLAAGDVATSQAATSSSTPSGLWSAERLMNTPRPALAGAPRLIWTSPVRKPTLINSL